MKARGYAESFKPASKGGDKPLSLYKVYCINMALPCCNSESEGNQFR